MEKISITSSGVKETKAKGYVIFDVLKFCFAQLSTRIQIIIAGGIVLLGLYLFFNDTRPFPEMWETWLEAFVTFSILGVAVFIWINEKLEEWREALPKKLEITYSLNGELYCQIYNAPLSGENDIRHWGQSIGQTILGRYTPIDFSGYLIGKPILKKSTDYFMEYNLNVYLRQEIQGIKQGSTFHFGENGDLIDKSSTDGIEVKAVPDSVSHSI